MKIHVEICAGTYCAMMGALNLGMMLEDVAKEMEDEISIEYVKCFDHCNEEDPPMVKVNGKPIYSASAEKVFEVIMDLIKKERDVVKE
ncbi:hypothetical protein BBF96_05480 [Anoxybacter fermentans]|uniref:NADH dehydrogenase n=1 Tax=Anoxybacter fermentans TaxID=1323375 RepID=A0A3Q9HRG9_9FIRM|nr:NAD(P)H-dependent oxidoreductase subunit E [Anoxybacter fermentans]AZR72888.1 hypothetical protein BBF96_05480 [Anoxybacter fermentans]